MSSSSIDFYNQLRLTLIANWSTILFHLSLYVLLVTRLILLYMFRYIYVPYAPVEKRFFIFMAWTRLDLTTMTSCTSWSSSCVSKCRLWDRIPLVPRTPSAGEVSNTRAATTGLLTILHLKLKGRRSSDERVMSNPAPPYNNNKSNSMEHDRRHHCWHHTFSFLPLATLKYKPNSNSMRKCRGGAEEGSFSSFASLVSQIFLL